MDQNQEVFWVNTVTRGRICNELCSAFADTVDWIDVGKVVQFTLRFEKCLDFFKRHGRCVADFGIGDDGVRVEGFGVGRGKGCRESGREDECGKERNQEFASATRERGLMGHIEAE